MNGTEDAPACGYPRASAARVALKTVKEYLEAHPEIERMRFVLLGKAGHAVNERRPDKDYTMTEIRKLRGFAYA